MPNDMKSSRLRSEVALDTRRLRHCTKVDDAESFATMEEFFRFYQKPNGKFREREREAYREE